MMVLLDSSTRIVTVWRSNYNGSYCTLVLPACDCHLLKEKIYGSPMHFTLQIQSGYAETMNQSMNQSKSLFLVELECSHQKKNFH